MKSYLYYSESPKSILEAAAHAICLVKVFFIVLGGLKNSFGRLSGPDDARHKYLYAFYNLLHLFSF